MSTTEQDVEAVLDCLRSGWLSNGPRVPAVEAALADRFGGAHAVAVSSGTAGLHLALLAAGVRTGDEVLVGALAPDAVVAALDAVGADPLWCDVVSEDEPWMDPHDAAERMSKKTTAVLVVHPWGLEAPIPGLGLPVVEDARSALHLGVPLHPDALRVLSFAGGRPCGVGEGGAVLCAHERHAADVRSRRSHCMTGGTWERHTGAGGAGLTYDVVDVGNNFRLDEPHAALLASKLARIDAELAEHRAAVGAPPPGARPATRLARPKAEAWATAGPSG